MCQAVARFSLKVKDERMNVTNSLNTTDSLITKGASSVNKNDVAFKEWWDKELKS